MKVIKMASGKILLVEDNANDEELTIRSLKKNRVINDITVVRDGAEAVDYLFARGAHANRDPKDLPDVILLDLNLPKISGLDVLRAIRADECLKILPVVILTSSKQDRDVIEGYRLGANSYVVKPVDFVQFSQAVQELGLYWSLRNQGLP
jgi:CheY-like chemotaxis protein